MGFEQVIRKYESQRNNYFGRLGRQGGRIRNGLPKGMNKLLLNQDQLFKSNSLVREIIAEVNQKDKTKEGSFEQGKGQDKGGGISLQDYPGLYRQNPSAAAKAAAAAATDKRSNEEKERENSSKLFFEKR